ncbi:DNA-binding response regulator [Acetobacter suratthaniensis]|uniref:Response regulator n=1 Tax=Acetobacter suratthaniensis TaxID=1502841 RepID=A0ABS3LMP7_9PROT|nr:DNA-binding response regulator [Acetobacter suratthaniensis]MBO1328641.1 response regulator [Acetobacter suratthaniensis]MCX2566688.1 DNA-binding response regulator [Acetobacter suratthaniensis]
MTLSATTRRCILVIDDDPGVLGIMDEKLSDHGYTVLLAQSGAAALEVVSNTTPDLILVDALMPGMTGWEVCEKLRRHRQNATTPIIFMTGLTETEHVLRAFEAGAVDYVTKPLRLEEVLARVNVHLEVSARIRATHGALDDVGRYFLALNRKGDIVWTTPHAARLLEHIPATLLAGLSIPSPLPAPGSILLQYQREDDDLSLIFVGATGNGMGEDERLLRITTQARQPERVLQDRLGLSAREAEVLLWISRGKTSRDIADILVVSPRTVDKHMEQIYNKTGLSTRAAAAATASRLLQEGQDRP